MIKTQTKGGIEDKTVVYLNKLYCIFRGLHPKIPKGTCKHGCEVSVGPRRGSNMSKAWNKTNWLQIFSGWETGAWELNTRINNKVDVM